ncbi:hypothetical protein BKA58DRAFT_420912 [Alternaria rosae]|uniref:uncharacterized protein n=1 Tax=Alternaria rosae TaxID=1187941 RepID=UPI001E8DD86F|nr:uncharacterized protein BKA58DRAFT_420912 [Alternaria rosae]KAH6870351.1 hypothetical protein BKA58DRAFT_420912 [Alternaria rosae]
MSAALFIRDHTTHDTTFSSHEECSICLDNYTTEKCLRITNIPHCNHYIGANCLDRMLRRNPHEEKKCPLCRTIWIPARALPFPPRNQSLGTSRRMANMFVGLDGIGADIAGNQLVGPGALSLLPFDTPSSPTFTPSSPAFTPTSPTFPTSPTLTPSTPPPQSSPALDGLFEPEAATAQAQNQQLNPIVIDSDPDSDADYKVQFQNYENYRREIADIRSRARDTRGLKSSRKKRRAAAAERESVNASNERNGEGADSSGNSNSENATATATGGTGTTGSGALNRLLNNCARNPFRPAEYTATATATAASPAPTSEVKFEQPASRTANHASARPAPTPYIQNPSPNTPDTPVDVDLTADELIELPAIQSVSAREAVRSRQLDHREASLSRREKVLITRQLALARHEEATQTQERRVNEIFLMLRRQREELEEMTERYREEHDQLLDRDY